MPTLPVGTLLHERYRILRPIGKGGMGAVYEAVDTRLRNTVAVKQLSLPGLDADRAFEREAQLLAGLRHAALPVVIDHFADSDQQFLVMQYIEGEDLAHYLDRQRGAGCALPDVLAWAEAILDALDYLHNHQPPIIHRDLKPANLKRTPTGDVVLLDFGLAKGRIDSDPTVASDDQSLYGFTLKYAPPEQIEGRPTDARSDLYALGATLYHLVTGIPPATSVDRMAAVRNGRPDPLVPVHRIAPTIDERLSQSLARALRLEPDDRFVSATEMRRALGGVAPTENL